MSPSPITPHIPQPLNIILQLPPQIVLQRHRAQFARHAVYLSVGEVADTRGLVDVEAGHEAFADFGADAVEGEEGAVDEGAFEEVDAEDEDLRGVRCLRE